MVAAKIQKGKLEHDIGRLLAYWAWCDTIMCSTGEEEGDEDLLRRRVYSKQKAMNEVD